MWGQIIVEAAVLTNFNFGFSTSKSEILLHLSQWQYWWWFWFALVWSVYFFLVIRTLHKRVLHFNPILNTSLRGHGKWGDFLVALVPLSWCGNILVNSNFILRMIEWQNESSLFTLRVQGKQWYWVYKFDSTLGEKLQNRPLNVGFNKWVIPSLVGDTGLENYTNISYLGTQLEFQRMYSTLVKDNQLTQSELNKTILPSLSYTNNILNVQNSFQANVTSSHSSANLDDTSNFAANLLLANPNQPCHLSKGVLNLHTLEILNQPTCAKSIFFKLNYALQPGTAVVKPLDTEFFWGFRQKKYKRLKAFSFDHAVLQNRGLRILSKALYENYKAVKYNKHRAELVPVTLARRLLRTKRTLVLPAHTNLTVITNSYDVVHSWFIPGLGLKLDCVPGRSTHHTFYIDNIGFYYGQCAEICGRYHHHMPIRVCALPLEHFIVWWEHKGVHRHVRL